jgi:hypothetical protein
MAKGCCKYGKKCSFAHTRDELRNVSQNTKVWKACKNFHLLKFCSYGSKCQYLHNEVILLDKDDLGKIEENPLNLYLNGMRKRCTYNDHLAGLYIKATMQNREKVYSIADALSDNKPNRL